MQPIYKGGYADLLTATIAASRAGQAPHIAQIFEVGTGTMLAAGKAVKQVWELAKETGVTIDPKTYIAVGARLLQPGGRADGLDAVQLLHRGDVVQQGCVPQGRASIRTSRRQPGRRWSKAAQAIKAKNAAEIPIDQRLARPGSSWSNTARCTTCPFATEADGFEGWTPQLEINSKAHVKHMARLLEMAKDGTFKYTGRDNAPTRCWSPARPASTSIPRGCAATW